MWPWIVLALVVIVAGVVLVVRSRPDDSPTARADRLTHELACPVCDGQSVAESSAPESRAIRDDIPVRIRAGETDAQVRAAYVHAYGDRILLAPPNQGIGLIAWVLPALVLLLGGFGIAIALRRWSRTPLLAATADDEAVVAAAREHDE
jgi:cytochrome c-type biogenesis protein CcmH